MGGKKLATLQFFRSVGVGRKLEPAKWEKEGGSIHWFIHPSIHPGSHPSALTEQHHPLEAGRLSISDKLVGTCIMQSTAILVGVRSIESSRQPPNCPLPPAS